MWNYSKKVGVSIVTSLLVPPDEMYAISLRKNPDGSTSISAAKITDFGGLGEGFDAVYIDECGE